MREVTAYATPDPRAPFEKTTIERRDLGPKDVMIVGMGGLGHGRQDRARQGS